MKSRLAHLALCAAAASILAACGGGDSPSPSDANSLLAITSATADASLEGAYGSSATGLSNVEEVHDIGNNQCDFAFNNVVKVGDSTKTMSGNVTYNLNAPTLASLSINISGSGYSFAGNGDNTTVDRANDRVTFDKVLSGAGTATLRISGFLPMRGNRPSGC